MQRRIMNILFYRYGSICEPDIIASFKHLGFNITEDTREVYNKQLLPSDCIKGLNELLKQDTYSFIFSINFFPSVSDVCNIWGIPYLCLIVDSPVLELFSTSLANPCNKVFLFDRQLYNDFHHINPDGIFHIPLATTSVTITLLQLWQVLLTEPDFHQIYHLSALYIQRNVCITKLLFLKKCVAM